MDKFATLPFEGYYYLEVSPDGIDGGMLLWERGLNPMSWNLDEILWQFWDGNAWKETSHTDISMLDKTLLKL